MSQPIPNARKRVLRPLCLLLIDDNPHDRDLVTRALSRHFGSVTVVPARDAVEFERAMAYEKFDAAILDYQLKWTTGLEGLRKIKLARPECPVLMFTASGNTEVAVEAMREGLDDFVTKTPKHYARLPFALEASLERAHQRRELAQARVDRAQLAAIVRSSDDAIISMTPDGFVTSWNDAAARLFGYASEEMEGESIDKIIPRELREQEATTRQRIANGEHADHYDSMRITKDEQLVPVSVRLSRMLDFAGRIIGISSIARDITERQRAELAVRLADQRKDAFLAILAHELRNPLAPIRYATRLLEPGVPAQMASDAKKMIDRQLAHMAHLLDDLLDVSRVTRGVLEIRRTQLDLREVIETAVAATRPLVDAARQGLTVSLPAEPLPVSGDPVRLAQIIGNLLHNATKYTPAGGKIAIAACMTAAEVLVSVKDDGVGIAPDALATIFELFVQLDPTGTRAAGGLGIGLSLARDLARLHGGQIEAHSGGRGLGSEFIVHLPLAGETPALTEPISAPEKITALGAATIRVLIVDDNIDAATSLSYVITLAGYQVRVAHDGNGALEVAGEQHPDVVLLDIGLPGMSGHEVARRLRAESWATDLQLIAVTGWGQEGDRAKSLEAGFDEHLTKPIDPVTLLQHISRAARSAA
ncbi:MAG TPA: response regulator [Steroidobacteraceae bacterium]|nr:response regulator [Steroidobacteraceae bacterium]